MNQRSKQASTARPSFKPRLPALAAAAKGAYRLSWLGGIKKGSRTFPLSYSVEALFLSLDDPGRTVTVTLPLGAFPHLAPSSTWVDGVFEGVANHQLRTVQVEFPEELPSEIRAKHLHELIPSGSYHLHDLPQPGWCRLITATDGTELVVPSSELIRAWYFFDSNVIPAVMAGAITNPAVLSHRHLPWIPELTHVQPPSGARIVHKNKLSIPSAQCLARLLFDPTAQEGASFLSKWIRSRLAQPSIPLPPVLPPFRGSATWEVRCVQIATSYDSKPRYLVTQLLSSNDPLPYDRLERLNQTDLRPGTLVADELEPIYRNITRNIFDDLDTIDLSGDGIDDSLLGVELASLAFGNSAVNVKTLVPAKGEQTHRGVWTEDGAVEVVKASVNPTAEYEDGIPSASQDNVPRPDQTRLKREHELKIAPLFEEVLNELCQHEVLASDRWATNFPFGGRTVQIHHPVKKKNRAFVVAAISNGLRHIYLLDAEPKGDSFRVVAVERRAGGPIPETRLRQWLAKFPYRPGCPWQCEESIKLGLVFRHMKHPTLHSTPEKMRANFKALISERVLDLIMG